MPTVSEVLLNEVNRRRGQGESIYALAKGAGIPEPTLNRWVNGLRGLSMENLNKLALYLGMELRPANRTSKEK